MHLKKKKKIYLFIQGHQLSLLHKTHVPVFFFFFFSPMYLCLEQFSNEATAHWRLSCCAQHLPIEMMFTAIWLLRNGSAKFSQRPLFRLSLLCYRRERLTSVFIWLQPAVPSLSCWWLAVCSDGCAMQRDKQQCTSGCCWTLQYISIPGTTPFHSKCWSSASHFFNCASPLALCMALNNPVSMLLHQLAPSNNSGRLIMLKCSKLQLSCPPPLLSIR